MKILDLKWIEMKSINIIDENLLPIYDPNKNYYNKCLLKYYNDKFNFRKLFNSKMSLDVIEKMRNKIKKD
jgi:hypothetical protein